MKVLHIITSLKIGGAETALYNLLAYWSEHDRQKSHHVIYIHDGPFVEKIKKLKIPVYKISGVVSSYDPYAFYCLLKYIKKINPDLIHGSLWSANFMASIVSWFFKIPLICDLHSNCMHHGILRNTLQRMIIKIPKWHVAVSDSVKKFFLQVFSDSIAEKKVLVIKNGIDAKVLRQKACEKRISREDLGFSQRDFIVGSVGRLHAIKRYDLLIREFKQFVLLQKKEERMFLRLCLIGGGPEEASLKALVNELDLKNYIFFLGEQPDPFHYYPLFDCFVLSSRSEGLSIALLEALSFGLPIITSSEGDVHDVIIDGVHGLLVPSYCSTKSLHAAMQELYGDKETCAMMKSNNLTLIENEYNIQRVALHYEKLYDEIIRGRG